VYTVYVTKYLYQILSLTLRVNICIAFAKKYVTNIRKRYYVTGRRKRFGPPHKVYTFLVTHKVYIILIKITTRVDLAID